MQKSLLQYLFLIWVVNRYNLLFILPFSVVIMSSSLTATTVPDSWFVCYRYHLCQRTETSEIKCSTKIRINIYKKTNL